HPGQASDGHGSLLAEITEGRKYGVAAQLWPADHRGVFAAGKSPVLARRQAFSDRRRICRGFIPADARNRVVARALTVRPGLPRRRAGAARFVDEKGHRLFPAQDLTIPHEFELPIL